MSYFPGLKLTKQGEQLLAKVNGNLSETILFSRAEIGNGEIGSDDEIRFLDKLKNKWKDINITDLKIVGKDKTQVKIELQFDNKEQKSNFLFRELGIFACGNDKNEILFAYSNAGENYDFIPAEKENPQTFVINVLIAITSDTKVNAVIDSSVYVTKETLDKKLAEKENIFNKNSGFNLNKTDNPENDTNKLFTSKGAFNLKNSLENSIASKTDEKYVDKKISDLVGSSPTALDTLNELAEALGNDANFSTTILNKISKLQDDKFDKSGGTITGALTVKNDLYVEKDIILKKESAIRVYIDNIKTWAIGFLNDTFYLGILNKKLQFFSNSNPTVRVIDTISTLYHTNNKPTAKELGVEPAINKKSGFNLDKTDNPENNSNKLFTAKGALNLKNSIDGKVNTSGGLLTGDLEFNTTNQGIKWIMNSDSASICFKNNGDDDTDSYLHFKTTDNQDEYFKWSHTGTDHIDRDWMNLTKDGLDVKGQVLSAGYASSWWGANTSSSGGFRGEQFIGTKGVSVMSSLLMQDSLQDTAGYHTRLNLGIFRSGLPSYGKFVINLEGDTPNQNSKIWIFDHNDGSFASEGTLKAKNGELQLGNYTITIEG